MTVRSTPEPSFPGTALDLGVGEQWLKAGSWNRVVVRVPLPLCGPRLGLQARPDNGGRVPGPGRIHL